MSLIKAIAASIWLGWYRDYGWSNPFASLAIRTIGPLATVLTAIIIYWFGSTSVGLFNAERLSYILIGSSFYAHIATYVWVPTLAIAEGKSNNFFPHVFISQSSSLPYLIGRTISSFLSSSIVFAISLTAGYYISILLLNSHPIILIGIGSISLLIISLLANLIASIGLSLMLGAYAIYASKFEWALPTYVAGLLMVFSEALFPASLLPYPLSIIASSLPFTQLIRAARESMIYSNMANYLSDIGIGTLGGLILFLIGYLIYSYSELSGRKKGIIDKKLV